jgi:hypothetical protein
MLKSFTSLNPYQLETELRKRGLALGDFTVDSTDSGGYVVLYDDGTHPLDIDCQVGKYGTSQDTKAGNADFVLGSVRTTVTAETASATQSFTTTLANGYVIPGSYTATVATHLETLSLKDLPNGKIVEVATEREFGTINYKTKEVAINFRDLRVSGNVSSNYTYSALPTMTDLPEACLINSIVVRRASGSGTLPTAFILYENAAKTVIRASGALTFVGSVAVARVDAVSRCAEIADFTLRGKRWLTLTGGDVADSFVVSVDWSNN